MGYHSRSSVLRNSEFPRKQSIRERTASTAVRSVLSDERVESAEGDICCTIFQTIQLQGVKSLRQVYDAVLFAVNNAEICISERLGHLTVRDDYDSVNGNTYNARVVSTNDRGVTTELNCVMFSQLCEEESNESESAPYGMLLLDSVDNDELYPYMPSERIRKDVSAVFVFTLNQPSVTNSTSAATDLAIAACAEDNEVGVTLQRAAFVKLRHPEFQVSEAAWQELQQDIAQWGDVLIKSIRSVLYSVP